MKRYKDLIFPLVASIVLIIFTHMYMFTITPVRLHKTVIINIKSGTSAWEISRVLEERGVVSNASLFMVNALFSQTARKLQAGRYGFLGELSPQDVVDILFHGKTLEYKVVIPEGSDIYDIARILSTLGLVDREDFINTATSKKTAKSFNIDAPSMEGYLFPDSYSVVPTMTVSNIISTMNKQFNKVYTPQFAERARHLRMTKNEVITMASLIEKEAITPDEMPIIASVFYNRLKKGMKLQSDPTAIYEKGRVGQRVYKTDLLTPSKYNTYLHKGLPPGPICNPGEKAIGAALYPKKTAYLYFVSQGDRSHYFSKSLKEHNQAIARIYK